MNWTDGALHMLGKLSTTELSSSFLKNFLFGKSLTKLPSPGSPWTWNFPVPALEELLLLPFAARLGQLFLLSVHFWE